MTPIAASLCCVFIHIYIIYTSSIPLPPLTYPNVLLTERKKNSISHTFLAQTKITFYLVVYLKYCQHFPSFFSSPPLPTKGLPGQGWFLR